MAQKNHAPGPAARRRQRPASMSIREGNEMGRGDAAAWRPPSAKPPKVTGNPGEGKTLNRKRHAKSGDPRASGAAAPAERVRSLVDTGLRLQALRDSDSLYQRLIGEAADLVGA